MAHELERLISLAEADIYYENFTVDEVERLIDLYEARKEPGAECRILDFIIAG